MAPTVLTPDEVAAGIAELDRGWRASGDRIVRTVEFPAFLTAVRFISELAPVAEGMDHHPDLSLSWRTVELTLSTHSAGGVTSLDLTLAGEIDQIIRRLS
jgi:4a-hydroxytetrahydrobiopterin dehydratase